jgi:hypothetical protein
MMPERSMIQKCPERTWNGETILAQRQSHGGFPAVLFLERVSSLSVGERKAERKGRNGALPGPVGVRK